MSLTALFDLISRIVMSIICLFITLKARHIYTVGTVACIISRFGKHQITILLRSKSKSLIYLIQLLN